MITADPYNHLQEWHKRNFIISNATITKPNKLKLIIIKDKSLSYLGEQLYTTASTSRTTVQQVW